MPNDREALEITISRHFRAPRETVFAQWLDADAIKDWFAPQTYEGLSAQVEARIGGRWQVEYRSPSGHHYREHGVFGEIVPFERLVLTLTQSLGTPAPETTIAVTFEDAADGGTLLRFHQSGFDSTARRDGNAEGWLGCFDKLAARIEPTKGRRHDRRAIESGNRSLVRRLVRRVRPQGPRRRHGADLRNDRLL